MRIRRPMNLAPFDLDMTPMIDMTFQLIAFFMVALNFSEAEQDQRINLPASELARPPESAYDYPLTIQLTKDETIAFGGNDLTLEGLQTALFREAQLIDSYGDKDPADVTVIIRADGSARAGKVQEIIQACQDAKFETFALRGRQSDVTTLTGP